MVLWIRNSFSESKGNLFFAKHEKVFVVFLGCFFATLKANILFMLQMLAKASLV